MYLLFPVPRDLSLRSTWPTHSSRNTVSQSLSRLLSEVVDVVCESLGIRRVSRRTLSELLVKPSLPLVMVPSLLSVSSLSSRKEDADDRIP